MSLLHSPASRLAIRHLVSVKDADADDDGDAAVDDDGNGDGDDDGDDDDGVDDDDGDAAVDDDGNGDGDDDGDVMMVLTMMMVMMLLMMMVMVMVMMMMVLTMMMVMMMAVRMTAFFLFLTRPRNLESAAFRVAISQRLSVKHATAAAAAADGCENDSALSLADQTWVAGTCFLFLFVVLKLLVLSNLT